jgi:hypothetical protein
VAHAAFEPDAAWPGTQVCAQAFFVLKRSSVMGGTEGSSPPCSATQFVVLPYYREKVANRRVDGPIRSIRGTGESERCS